MSAKPPAPSSFPSHTPNSFYPFLSLPSSTDAINTDNAPVHHQMDPSVPLQPRYPSTCIPSLMPPGVDPTSVDFRTFFPYIPNEVKHRKRTSRLQLKVLEEVFRKDTKPNAVLRKKLATELEMSPRAVQVLFPSPPLHLDACSPFASRPLQVWFQNRYFSFSDPLRCSDATPVGAPRKKPIVNASPQLSTRTIPLLRQRKSLRYPETLPQTTPPTRLPRPRRRHVTPKVTSCQAHHLLRRLSARCSRSLVLLPSPLNLSLRHGQIH